MNRRVRVAKSAYRVHLPSSKSKGSGRSDPRPPAKAAPSEEAIRAKLFANGRSQAVRLPKEFRMPGDEVSIRREGRRVILEPLDEEPVDAKGWPIGFWAEIRRRAKTLQFPDPEPMGVHFLEPEEYGE
jgi:antitoxin VapB